MVVVVLLIQVYLLGRLRVGEVDDAVVLEEQTGFEEKNMRSLV